MADYLKWYDTVGSTNTEMALARAGLPDCSIFAARRQTAGRGQRGNRWESRPGENLTFSLLLKPVSVPVRAQFIVSEAVALGITDYLAEAGAEAKVKWPNDIYVGDRKICGVLIENYLSGDFLADSVVGIGLNLNQKEFDPSLPNPTSLSLVTGASYILEDELESLVSHILSHYRSLGDPYRRNYLEARYLKKLYRRGEWAEFEEMPQNDVPVEKRQGRRFKARILGIDPSDFLLLERTDGTVVSYAFKEIKYII